MPNLTASYEYSGMPDYWGGNGRRWDDDAGCVFSYYDGKTSLRDIVEDAVNDFCAGGDCDSFPEDVTEDDVRAALLACLSDAGRADYESGAISEFSAEYAQVNGLDECRECHALCGESHEDDCTMVAEWRESGDWDEDEAPQVELEDCEPDYEYSDSPMFVFLLECSRCDECGELADVDELGVCAACIEKAEGPCYALEYSCACGNNYYRENDSSASCLCPECYEDNDPVRSEDISADCAPCPYNPGDRIYWENDADGRVIVIAVMAVNREQIVLTGTDGFELSCHVCELSRIG
jgi:hypothetical protein